MIRDKLPIESKGYFGLIRVEMVHPNASDGFNIGRVLDQDIFVEFDTCPHCAQTFLDSVMRSITNQLLIINY